MSLKKWKSHKTSYVDAVNYIIKRKAGEITSLKTPWAKVNDAGADGIEWNSTVIIAGRPASGKTLIKDQIVREAFKRNPAESFNVLEFQFEMVGRVTAMRSFSAHLDRSYKYLCSAEGTMTNEEIQSCMDYAREMAKYPIDIVDEPCTVTQFRNIVSQYMEENASKTVTKKYIDSNGVPQEEEVAQKTYKKTIITLDHSLLVKKDAFEKDKHETLFSLGEALTALKRKYPIIFIILSQLNREIDKPDRNEPGKYGNYILESDLYGADALLQHADLLIGIDRPLKRNLGVYGPDRWLIPNINTLVFHFIKARNGDTRMTFMEAEFQKMSVSEMKNLPPQQEYKLKTKA